MKKNRPAPPPNRPGRNPRNSTGRNNGDFFKAIYGDEDEFKIESETQYAPKYSGYNEVARSTRVLPGAPVTVNLKSSLRPHEDDEVEKFRSMYNLPAKQSYVAHLKHLQKQIPQITIPKKQTIQQPLTQRTPPLQPLAPRPPAVSAQTPRAANDNLTLFDEVDFDGPGFEKWVKDMLKSGPIPAYSQYLQHGRNFEWLPCFVTAIDGNNFTIRWKESGKLKVVNRLSVRLECEDEERFEQRRQLAEKNRQDAVDSIREQTYLTERAANADVQQDPEMIEHAIKRLPRGMRSSPLIVGMVQELQELYALSYTVSVFESEWENPETAKIFEAEGLVRPIKEEKEVAVIPILKHSRLNIVLPKFSELMAIHVLLDNFVAEDFLKEPFDMFKPPMQLGFFLEQIYFQFRTKHAQASSTIANEIQKSLLSIAAEADIDIAERFMKMINMRYNDALATIVIEMLGKLVPTIKNRKVTFCLKVESDLETFDTPSNMFMQAGHQYINHYGLIFEESPVYELRFDDKLANNLKVWLPELESARLDCLQQWDDFIGQSFDSLQRTISEMRHVTSVIPSDPASLCREVLPKDFDSVCFEGKAPEMPATSVNLEKLREVIKSVRDSYNQMLLDFEPIMVFGALHVDFKVFFEVTEERHNKFNDLVFKYLNAQTDKQVTEIGGMIRSLMHRATCAPEDVEAWHEKHLLLEHLQNHVKEIRDTLDYLLVMLDFMADFLYEPAQSFRATYNIKNGLKEVTSMIGELTQKDSEEKKEFIEKHSTDKERLRVELNDFQQRMLMFNKIDPNNESARANQQLLFQKAEFDKLMDKAHLYQSRDEKLGLEKTEYPISKEIIADFDLFLPIWNIAFLLDTDANKWLGTIFKELNVQLITDTMVSWEKTLKDTLVKLDSAKEIEHFKPIMTEDRHPLIKPTNRLLERVQFFILHLPIIKYLCNPHLRARHWKQISEATGIQIGPNDGLTWNWLMEGGIEENLMAIASISRSANMECRIEKGLQEMIEELQTMSLHVEHTPEGIRLEDPSGALVTLASHQEKMQEIFVPPFVTPFISKIRDYEILAQNLRQVLKQSIETENRINELKPAMESTDLRTQHANMTTMFDKGVKKFENFVNGFKLTVTFHHILSNQTTVDDSNGISNDFNIIRQKLDGVLEQKRAAFPRFRLLSDSQLIKVISHSHKPSKIANIFGIMYPAVREALFEDDLYCTGFISLDNEPFLFENKVAVTPDAVEGWYKAFDLQITSTLKNMAKKILQAPISNIEKMTQTYPSQLLTLVFETFFTSNVTKCFASFENSFTDSRIQVLHDQLRTVYNSLNNDLKILCEAYKRSNTLQITNMIAVHINQVDLLKDLIENKVDSAQGPLWLSKLKYKARNIETDDFTIDVQLGPCTREYGFEFTGSRMPAIQTEIMARFFSSLMMCLCHGSMALVCGAPTAKKTESLSAFLNACGKQPFVYPCQYHSTLEHMKEFMQHAFNCNAIVVFKDLYNLNFDVLSEFSMALIQLKPSIPKACGIFGTYTLTNDNDSVTVPENLRFAFRPVNMPEIDTRHRYYVILKAMGAEYPQKTALKLSVLTETVSRAFEQPLRGILAFPSIIKLIQQSPISGTVPDPYEEIQDRIIKYITDDFSMHDIGELIRCVDATFERAHTPYNPTRKIANYHENESINSKLNDMAESLDYHFGVFIVGKSLTGKSAIIRMLSEAMHKNVEFINPLSLDMGDLFGDKTSGQLSSVLQDQSHRRDWIVFDGPCDYTWMESLTLGLSNPRLMHFGDGSMINVEENVRFVFESDDLSAASPATLAQCSTIYIGDGFIPLDLRMKHFIEELENDTNFVEPLSKTIVSTQVPVSMYSKMLADDSMFFVSKLSEMHNQVTSNLCFNSFLKFLKSLIYNFFIPSTNKETIVYHTYEELVENTPKFIFFSLFWSFGGIVVDDERLKVESEMMKLLKQSKIEKEVGLGSFSIGNVFFDIKANMWREWSNIMESGLVAKDAMAMTDREPKHLLIPQGVLMPTVFLAHELLSQGESFMISSPHEVDESIFTGVIHQMPYIMAHFSPHVFTMSNGSDHHELRQMVNSVLPDARSNVSHSMALRIPLLSLIKFDASSRSSAAEMIRYTMEHHSIPNDHGPLKEGTSGLCMVLCSDESAFKSRLAGHVFSVRVSAPSRDMQLHAISRAISVLWEVNSKQEEIANALLEMFEGARQTFRFSISHLFNIMQRVAIVMLNHDPSLLTDVIGHQAVRVFYDGTHSEEILATLNVATRNIGNSLGQQFTSVFDIAGNSILTNINNDHYRQVFDFNSLANIQESKPKRRGTKRKSLMRFTTSEQFNEVEGSGVLEPFRGMKKNMIMDILALSQMLSIPKTHVTIFTEQPGLSNQLINKVCALSKTVIINKKLTEPLLKTYHDAFIMAGEKKIDHILYIDANTLTEEDEDVLPLLMKTSAIYGLFGRGELLDKMTKIYESTGKFVDPFGEESIESLKNYNDIIADFKTDAEMFLHICVVRQRPISSNEKCEDCAIYTPFFSTDEYIDMFFDKAFSKMFSFKNEYSLKMIDLVTFFSQLRKSKLLEEYPYLMSTQNITHIMSAYVARQNKRHSFYTEKLNQYEDVQVVYANIKMFLEDEMNRMEKMESELVTYNEELETTGRELEKLQLITEEEIKKVDAESKILAEEENHADMLQKELEVQLKATRAIVADATKELKSISARDIAVIKGMNHPPPGVQLVVKAMCVVMGQTLDAPITDDGLASAWAVGKRFMNDPSFLNQLVQTTQDVLHPNIIKVLREIISNPNFDPSAVERSSYAAKSICKFIRALVPFNDAMIKHKDKMAEVEAVQKKLNELRKQQELAMLALSKAKKDAFDTQERRQHTIKNKEKMEELLSQQRQKIAEYRKVEQRIISYIDSSEKAYEKMRNEAFRSETLVFLQEAYMALAGPFDADGRDKVCQVIVKACEDSEIDLEKRMIKADEIRDSLLLDDEAIVAKWKRGSIPVSKQWQESVSFISPENGRWVVAEGVRGLATSFLKKLMNRPMVYYMSAMAPDFDRDFVAAISSTVGIVVYDFDFENPSQMVLLVANSRDTGEPFEFNNETITVPHDFFVVFDVTEIPTKYSLGMNVELVSLHIDSNVSSEQVAHRSFELIENNKFVEATRADIKLVEAIKSEEETEENLRKTLVNASHQIFKSEKIQSEFDGFVKEFEEYHEMVGIHRKHIIEQYEDFNAVHIMAHELHDFYQGFPIRGSLWKMFDAAFSDCLGIRAEEYAEKTRTSMMHMIAAALPLEEKLTLIQKAANLKTIEEALSYADCAATRLQEPLNILKNTRASRPIMCYSRDSFVINAIFATAANRGRFQLLPCKEVVKAINAAMQTGTILCTMCTSRAQLMEVLAPINKVLAGNFVSSDFRFIICALTDNFEDVSFSGLLTKVDVIHLDHPHQIRTVFSSTMNAMPKMSSNELIPRFALFDAVVSVRSFMLHAAPMMSFENFVISLQLLNIATSENLMHIGKFLADYFYATENLLPSRHVLPLWARVTSPEFVEAYPSPMNLSEAAIMSSVAKMPVVDQPRVFGETEAAFDFVSRHTMESKRDQKVGIDEIPSLEIGIEQVDRAMRLEYVLAKKRLRMVSSGSAEPSRVLARRIAQIASSPDVIDFSLLVNPGVFMQISRLEEALKRGSAIEDLVVVIAPRAEPGDTKIRGLWVENAAPEGDHFIKKDGCFNLEEAGIRIVKMGPGLRPASLYHNGRKVSSLFIKCDSQQRIDFITDLYQ